MRRQAQPTPVEYTVSLAQTSSLELGLWPVQRGVSGMLTALRAAEQVRCPNRLVDMLGVVCPVRRDIQSAARFQAFGDKLEEAGLHDAPLVVAFLRPWVGEVEV